MGPYISKHPKGMLLQFSTSNKNIISAAELRRILGAPVSSVANRGYVIPTRFAFSVLKHFKPIDSNWDLELLEIASRQSTERDAQLRAQMEVERALSDPHQQLRGYTLSQKLDVHQLEAVAAISVPSLQGIAIFDEQGTGKTITALAAFDYLKESGNVKRLLVIAPKTVLGSWNSDCIKLFGEKYHIETVIGNSAKRRRSILKHHDILLVGYETAISEQSLLRLTLSARRKTYMLIVDESYFVKNPETARAKVVSELRPFCERAVVLCGTPAPNSPADIVNQINLVDGGLAFGSKVIPQDPHEAAKVVRQALGNAIYLRRLKEDVFPAIPLKGFEKVFFGLRPVQRKLYDQAHKDLVLTVRSMDDREFARQLTSFIARRVALLQICSNPGGIDPLYVEGPGKLLVLDKMIRELVDAQGKKVVIWSFFRHSVQSIAERFKSYGLVRIDGSVTKIEDRMDAINRFQEDPNTLIFVGNAASAGTGITLTAAHHAIYESFSNQAAHYMQSVDRVHRRGQTHNVTYHVILANDTIEEREFDRLVNKERAARDLLGDHYKEPITRERFLADLGEAL
jgi:SNF2 family DNA or RNA helicase